MRKKSEPTKKNQVNLGRLDKQERQIVFRARAAAAALSPEQENDAAKLFPASAVAKMKVLKWVR